MDLGRAGILQPLTGATEHGTSSVIEPTAPLAGKTAGGKRAKHLPAACLYQGMPTPAPNHQSGPSKDPDHRVAGKNTHPPPHPRSKPSNKALQDQGQDQGSQHDTNRSLFDQVIVTPCCRNSACDQPRCRSLEKPNRRMYKVMQTPKQVDRESLSRHSPGLVPDWESGRPNQTPRAYGPSVVTTAHGTAFRCTVG